MMKAIVVLASLTFLCCLSAQCQNMPVDKETGLITYTEVVKCDSVNAKKLYQAAELWMVHAYSTDGYVNHLNNDENMTIEAAPRILVYDIGSGQKAGFVYYTLTIECRNGRYKYTFTNLHHLKAPDTNECDGGNLETVTYTCPSLIMNKKQLWADIKTQANDYIISLISDMKQSIAKTITVKKSDW